MARTVIASGDPQAVKKFSAFLAYEAVHKSYWLSKFMGVYRKDGQNKPITLITDLEKDAGDTVSFDIVMRLHGQGVEGDNQLKGKEEKLVPYTDELKIDQIRHGVDTGGRMTKKRTVHDLRKVARDRLSGWFAMFYDENIAAYCSGARGVATDWLLPTTWTGRAGMSLDAPDSDHQMFAGKKAKDTITSSDILTVTEIDRIVAHVSTLDPPMTPVMVDGKPHFIYLMHPWQKYDLRTNTNAGQWLDIVKAAEQRGKDNPIFSGALGIYNDVVLHEHRKVVRFDDYGSGEDLPAARGLFFGSQMAAIAFGSPGEGLRYSWHEELEDRGNVLVVDVGSIVGTKKIRFSSKDFGVIAHDCYSADPNA